VGVVHLVVLACVLRATTKKVVNFFLEEIAPTEKILATPACFVVRI